MNNNIAAMRKTARSTGAVGKNALVPRITKALLDELTGERLHLLDIGAGHGQHIAQYQKHDAVSIAFGCDINAEGRRFAWDSHDEPRPTDGGQIQWGRELKYFDVVTMSNVLNVQGDALDIVRLIRSAMDSISPNGTGYLVCNFPVSPRRNNCTSEQVLEILFSEGASRNVTITRKGGTKQAPVWVCELEAIK